MPTTVEDDFEVWRPSTGLHDPPDGEDACCWICGAPVVERHCKIVCPRCGFMRDCSDP